MPDSAASPIGQLGGTAANITGRAGSAVTSAKIKTPAGDAPVLPLFLLGFGLYLLWFGVHYFRDANVVWPSDPIKQALQGQGTPKPTKLPTVTAQLAGAIQTAQSEAPGPSNTGGADPALPASGAYSESQLQTIWKLAGGSPAEAVFAAGVAMAESGGRPKVTSRNPDGGTNVGLWQLDTKGEGAGHTVAELQNPATNAKITVAKTSNGRDWSAWADSYISAHGTKGAGSGTTQAPGTTTIGGRG